MFVCYFLYSFIHVFILLLSKRLLSPWELEVPMPGKSVKIAAALQKNHHNHQVGSWDKHTVFKKPSYVKQGPVRTQRL